MSDNKNERGSADRSRINVNPRHEVEYWTRQLGVTEQELVDAVKRVGVMADDVKRSLARS